MLVIALESTRIFTAEASGNWIGSFLSWFHPVSAVFIDHANYFLRKTGHFIGYTLLSAFAFHGWMETLAYQTDAFLRRSGKQLSMPRRWHLRAATLAVLCTLIVASLDEFHQLFIPGRTGNYRDVILDTMGGVFAQIVLLIYWSKNASRKKTAEKVELTEVMAKES